MWQVYTRPTSASDFLKMCSKNPPCLIREIELKFEYLPKLSKLSIWFESLPKNGAFIRCLVRFKLEIRLLHEVII
jgi:hypothetical protein